MQSIGILLYGKLEFDDIVKMLDYVSKEYNVDYTKYELVMREVDTESRQKYGYWDDQKVTDYIRTLSPNIYNLFLDRFDKLPFEGQRKEVLNYIISVNGMVIILMEPDYEIPQDELDLISDVKNIRIKRLMKV